VHCPWAKASPILESDRTSSVDQNSDSSPTLACRLPCRVRARRGAFLTCVFCVRLNELGAAPINYLLGSRLLR
jgi:hypothetical protein